MGRLRLFAAVAASVSLLTSIAALMLGSPPAAAGRVIRAQQTPSSSASPTETGSPTASPTETGSPSATPSPTGSGSPSPSASPSPSPTGPSAFTIAVVPPVAVWGTTFSIAGSLTCFGVPVAGATITVQRRIAGTFTFDTIGQATTDASGAYAMTTRPDRSADYRALVVGGTGPCGLSTTVTARADVRPGVAANAVATRVPRGGTAGFRGRVLPGHPGQRVYLQVFQGSRGVWANVLASALDAASNYRVTYRRPGPGFLLFRIVYPTQHSDHTWNVSRNVRVDWI